MRRKRYMGITMIYHFNNLEDLAAFFEGLSRQARNTSENVKVKPLQRKLAQREAYTYHHAASIIRSSKIGD